MRVVVVGAGVFGSWTALWLLRRGASVTLVEQYGPGNPLSSSGDESRVAEVFDLGPPFGSRAQVNRKFWLPRV